MPAVEHVLELPSGARPTVQLSLDQLPFDADEAPAAPIAPPAPSRPPPTLIDPELQKLKEAFRAAKPSDSPALPSVIVADAPPAPIDPSAALRTPPVPLEPVTTNVTPPMPLEPVSSVPSPSRPRRKLPAGARSARKQDEKRTTPIDPAPASLAEVPAEKRTTPIESEPVALADAPVIGTDPRILSKGQANRRVLDALKQVKRRGDEEPKEPSVEVEAPGHGTRADRLAAGTLQVAIRMEQGGRLDEAVRYLEGAISKSPDAPTLYNRLAIILMREHGDLLRAEHLLQKAIELAPGNPVYEKNLQAVVQKRAMRGK